jgi:hypothetical protein
MGETPDVDFALARARETYSGGWLQDPLSGKSCVSLQSLLHDEFTPATVAMPSSRVAYLTP